MTVSITGIGVFTAVGRTADEVFESLCIGRSGLSRPPVEHPIAGSIEVAGIAPEADPRAVAKGPELNVLDRVSVLALLAAQDALDDAKLVIGQDVDPFRAAVIVGGVGGMSTLEQQMIARHERGRGAVSPYLLTGVLPNMAAARIAMKHGIQGHSTCTATACAAGAQAIAEGARLIRDGEADIVLCGASEAPLFPTFAETFDNARALARGWDDPRAASRPFDRRRNGFVLAEGAAILVLERTEHADARGVAGYADVVGWGSTTDAHHPTTPRPDGRCAAESMRRALARGGISPAEVGYLNAHGTGTKLGDVAETSAIRAVFEADCPPVSSSKGVTGHLLGASGVVEAAASAIAVARGVMPPTHNLDDPDPACDVEHIRATPRTGRVHFALSNSFGFGGQNVSLLLGRASTGAARV